ncbi:hypothetical protein D3C87_262440 [compost metagenome]
MKLLGILLILLLVSVSCKKKTVQPDPDQHCGSAEEVSADFWIEEMTTGNANFAKYTDTDSILGSKSVRFRAKLGGAVYKWYIGSEIITDSVFSRFFGPATLGQTIPVTLVVRKTPNNNCFPADDGYDSIVKYLTITDYPMEDAANQQIHLGSIEGTYRVKSAHLPDSFNVTVDYVYDNGNTPRLNVFNYDGNGSNCLLNILMNDGYNYRQLFLTGGTTTMVCDYLQGDILHRSDGTAEMNFRFYYEGHPNYNTKRYKGRKL